MKDRYDTSDLPEAQFEPGSQKQVLKNLLGIRKKAAMDDVEEQALQKATDSFVQTYAQDHRFKSEDVRRMHQLWLADIYPWAGQYRKVNLSKTGFVFSMALHIPELMREFEDTVLTECTPCREKTKGNGRVARLLTTLMALQANLPLLDFRGISGKLKSAYFAAIQAGMKRDYEPMETVIGLVIERTLKRLS
ncbi:MAG: Fic family protein [Elusimicrobia bacterium]|nr:Fic family protein [Elusimicrobiota bacterium]